MSECGCDCCSHTDTAGLYRAVCGLQWDEETLTPCGWEENCTSLLKKTVILPRVVLLKQLHLFPTRTCWYFILKKRSVQNSFTCFVRETDHCLHFTTQSASVRMLTAANSRGSHYSTSWGLRDLKKKRFHFTSKLKQSCNWRKISVQSWRRSSEFHS